MASLLSVFFSFVCIGVLISLVLAKSVTYFYVLSYFSNGVDNKAYSNLSLSSMKPVYIDNEEGSMGDYYGGYGTSADSKNDYFDYYANSRQNPVQSSV